MAERLIENNKVNVVGKIVSDFEYSHEVYGEKFYIAHLEIERASGKMDVIPVMLSDRLVNGNLNWKDIRVEIEGQFRSWNVQEGDKRRCRLCIFIKKIDEATERYDDNRFYAEGYICKEPTYRETPLGRQISDVFIAVNRPFRKSDYIPCIVWGRNAIFASGLDVGAKVKIGGRIQSRDYFKNIGDGKYELRTAYEVSANRIDLVRETEA